MFEIYWLTKDENGSLKEEKSIFAFDVYYIAKQFAAKMVIANKEYLKGFMIVNDSLVCCKHRMITQKEA